MRLKLIVVAVVLLASLVVTIVLAKPSTASSQDHLTLPNIEGLTKEEIAVVFEAYPLTIRFKEEVSTCVLDESVFLYYQEYDVYDRVFEEMEITVVISAPSED